MVTVDKVKVLINANPIPSDERIQALIELSEQWIKGYCNIKEIPDEYDRNIIKMVEFDLNRKSGLQSESLSRHSVSYSTDYPPDILKGLRRRLRWP